MIQNGDHCSAFTANTNTCITCKTGYHIDTGDVCTANNVAGCATYTENTNTCTGCNDYYFLDTSGATPVCTQPINDCKIYTDGNVCTTCRDGYFNSSSTCDLTSNCKTMLNATDC